MNEEQQQMKKTLYVTRISMASYQLFTSMGFTIVFCGGSKV